MNVLETLLVVYSLLLILNGAVAIVLWFVYRKPILISLIGTWAFTLFNFVSQAATLNTELGSILGFGTYIFSSWCLCRIISTVLHEPFEFRPFWLGWGQVYCCSRLGTLRSLISGSNPCRLPARSQPPIVLGLSSPTQPIG